MSCKTLNFVIVPVIILWLCLEDHSVFGNYESNTNDSARQFLESPRYSSGYSHNSFKPLVTTSSSSPPRPVRALGVKSGRIKMKLLESVQSPVMDHQSEYPSYEDKPYPPPYTNAPVPMMVQLYGQGQDVGGVRYMEQPQNHDHFSHFHDIETKEAAVKGFGVGLVIGLGVLGGLEKLFKWILFPLLGLAGLSAFIPFLLFLGTPIPVITMGKMLGHVAKRDGKKSTRLQEAIEEVMQKLPDLSPTTKS